MRWCFACYREECVCRAKVHFDGTQDGGGRLLYVLRSGEPYGRWGEAALSYEALSLSGEEIPMYDAVDLNIRLVHARLGFFAG